MGLFTVGFLEITWVDALDICLVSYLLYQLYKVVRGSAAVKVLLGFLFVYLSFLIVKAVGMRLLTQILSQLMGVGAVGVLILFQQEIRKFFLTSGKTSLLENNSFFSFWKIWRKPPPPPRHLNLAPILDAVKNMAAAHVGALIVLEQRSDLKFYAETGDDLDAVISKRMLLSIFNKYSPMHDGAVIISRQGRIAAARCILPVSESGSIPAALGLRHRAAIGLSEVTDALVLVVSEETGQTSLVRDGRILHNLSGQELRSKLNLYLFEEEEDGDAPPPPEKRKPTPEIAA